MNITLPSMPRNISSWSHVYNAACPWLLRRGDNLPIPPDHDAFLWVAFVLGG